MRGSYLVFPCFDRSWISPTRIELIVSLISNGCFEERLWVRVLFMLIIFFINRIDESGFLPQSKLD